MSLCPESGPPPLREGLSGEQVGPVFLSWWDFVRETPGNEAASRTCPSASWSVCLLPWVFMELSLADRCQVVSRSNPLSASVSFNTTSTFLMGLNLPSSQQELLNRKLTFVV